MESLKIAAFGCWNVGCDDNSGQKEVSKLIKDNEEKYNFMIILGDNYYANHKNDKEKYEAKKEKESYESKKEEEYKGFICPPKKQQTDKKKDKKKDKIKDKDIDIDINDMNNGFNCLNDIYLQKKLIMGNHDIQDGKNHDCINLSYQLNELNKDVKIGYDIKFPFGSDVYGTLLILYIDTTIYRPLYNKPEPSTNVQELSSGVEKITSNCYEKLNYIDIKNKQNDFIKNTLKTHRNNIKHVLICGHEPLITYKIKCDNSIQGDDNGERDKSEIIIDLINIIFEQKNIYQDIPFTYLCADYHIYQYSKINQSLDQKQQFIDQIIVGTGGGLLDDLTPYTRSKELKLGNYTLEIQPNNVNDNNTYKLFSHGINQYGYGEITYKDNTLTHSFIPITNSKLYKNKYLKYKNKYLNLKKNHNYLFTK
jgi:hypothetical protein